MSFVFLNNIKRWIICWFYKGQSFWSLYHHELFILNLITVTKAFIISSFPCIFKIKIVTLFTLYLLATFWFLFWNVYSNEKWCFWNYIYLVHRIREMVSFELGKEIEKDVFGLSMIAHDKTINIFLFSSTCEKKLVNSGVMFAKLC